MDTVTDTRITGMSSQLVVADIKRTVEFYINILGFSIQFSYDDFYAGIVKDGYSIHIKSGNPLTEVRQSKRRNEDLDIVFSVSGIESLYEDILSKPAEIVQPLRNMPYGREFYIADPDGYIIAFLEDA